MTTTEIKTIDVQAKEYFDRVNGNSYFSAIITLNFGMSNSVSYYLPYQYGHGNHFIEMANQFLIDKGLVTSKQYSNGSYPQLWQYCRDNNIILRTSKQENCRKRDLMTQYESDQLNKE